MRKENSTFITKFISEEGTKLENRDYYGFVELDYFACYVLADSLDEDPFHNSAQIAVESIIQSFSTDPSMRAAKISGYIKQADKDLKAIRDGMRLKASVTVIVTDYRKLRYCSVGNSRFYLLRNDRFLIQSKDQSLTRNLVDKERLPLDKAALHEERNNLYSYLGKPRFEAPEVSKKIALKDGDTLLALTRGIWEYCDDGELFDASKDAKDPEDILNQVEELILSKQPDEIDNYTLAATFIDKVYEKPKSARRWKRILMIAIPILVILITLFVVWFISHRKKLAQEASLISHLESGEAYLRYDNYNKARDDYSEAIKLAQSLKKDKEKNESDANLKLIDQIILADSYLMEQDYQMALDQYLNALVLSYEADNIGKTYIEKQLEKTRAYIEVFDLLEEGDRKKSIDDLDGAKAAYQQAKLKASGLYFNDAKKEAVDKITEIDNELAEIKKAQEQQEQEDTQKAAEESKAAEEEVKEAAMQEVQESIVEQELEKQERLNAQKNAIELEVQGNDYFKEGSYSSAITYYEISSTMYQDLDMWEKVASLQKKIETAEKLMNEQSKNETAAAQQPETQPVTEASIPPTTEAEQILEPGQQTTENNHE